MRNKKYLWVLLFTLLFSKLYADKIEPICEISICDKNVSKYGGYQQTIESFTRQEVSNILEWFNRLEYPAIQLNLPTARRIHYYYYDGNSKNKDLKGFRKHDMAKGIGGRPSGLCDLSLEVHGCYASKKILFNAFQYYSIDDFLNKKSPNLKKAKELRLTLAHELFHGIQVTPTRNKGQGRDPLLWLSESMPEAVGYAYVLEIIKQNKVIKDNNTLLDIPFNYSEDKGLTYARYPFFLWLGKYLKSKDTVAYLKHFTQIQGDGLKSFQEGLKSSKAKEFNKLLPLYIAEKTNSPKAYYSMEGTDYTIQGRGTPSSAPITINFKKIEHNEPATTPSTRVEPLALYPNIFYGKYFNFSNATKQDLLRLVTIKVKAKKGKEDLTLVHEDKVYIKDEKEIEPRIVRILVKADKEVPLGFAKVVNIAKDLTKTKERNFEFSIEDEPFRFYLPCFNANKAVDMSIDNLRGIEQTFPIFNAKKVYLKPHGGSFKKDTTIWTAPSGSGELDADLIFEDVILHDNKNGKKDKDIVIENFTKVRYSSSGLGCGAKMTLSTGESLIYSAEKNTTMMKDGFSTLLLKKPFMYMHEPKEGWCFINFESFFKMMSTQMKIFSGQKQEFANELMRASVAIRPYNAQTSQDLSDASKEISSAKISITKEKVKINDDTWEDPEVTVEKFDFYRLPHALNKMLSLKRLRQVLKSRRIGKYRNELYVATSEDVYIELLRKPCKGEKGKCNFALFGEKNGEKIKILYNKANLISTISSDGTDMHFDYGAYSVESVPLHSPSCFDK